MKKGSSCAEGLSRLEERLRSTKSREYRMRKRAEDVHGTRQRIVEATVELHRTVGLAATNAEIADRAQVTRATVYRHFPDAEHLFAACSAHWQAQQHPPDPERWVGPDAHSRLRAALRDVYRFYAEASDLLVQVDRDRALMPTGLAQAHAAEQAVLRDGVLALLPAATRRRLMVRRVVGHVLEFRTWHSLVEQGLGRRDAVELMAGLVERASEPRGGTVAS